MIDILIPLADGHRLYQKVIRSIGIQTVSCCILPISREKQKRSRHSEVLSRKIAIDHVKGDYVVMMDRMVVLPSETTIQEFINELQSKGIDAIAARRIGHIEHDFPVITCAIYKTESLKKIDFTFNIGERCTCEIVNRQIKIEYSSTIQVQELTH